MGMNIKNREAHRLERLRTEQRDGVAEALLMVGQDTAKRLSPDFRQTDVDDLLYDDEGLPA